MNWELLVWIGLFLAAVPGLLFFANCFAYQPLPSESGDSPVTAIDPATSSGRSGVSVLIPARNEEENLPATLEAVLASTAVDLELIVLDDHSTDRTAAIVRQFQRRDSRVRLESAPPLPARWCGKQHACHVLSQLASRPWLVFIDADVRLEPGALQAMVRFMKQSGADLGSGIPRQETGTFSEKLLIPLIHFILLGFLPMHSMRRSGSPSFAAGCGQLFVARREAYRLCGGHSRIPSTLHDGLRLPRVFRQFGLRTDLFDATSKAVCRMYRSHAQVWSGLAKNAIEGLGAPKIIVPMTLLLLGGQILPWVVVIGGYGSLQGWHQAGAVLAIVLSLAPRLVSLLRFRQPVLGALLHPLGILALLGIQWFALARCCLGRPSSWKGRSYSPKGADPRPASVIGALVVLGVASLSVPALAVWSVRAEVVAAESWQLPSFSMDDQFGGSHAVMFPAGYLTLMTCADREGASQVGPWIQAVKERGFDTNRLVVRGVADVRKVPSFLRSMVRRRFAERYSYPVMMDWKGLVASKPVLKAGKANVLLLDGTGRLQFHFSGEASREATLELTRSIQALLEAKP